VTSKGNQNWPKNPNAVFQTDLKTCDYSQEHGATRLFEAEKLLRDEEARQAKQDEEDKTNPMKMLENRTKMSRFEMEALGATLLLLSPSFSLSFRSFSIHFSSTRNINVSNHIHEQMFTLKKRYIACDQCKLHLFIMMMQKKFHNLIPHILLTFFDNFN